MKRSLAALAAALCAAGSISVAAAQPARGHTQYGTWGVDLSAMDRSVRPGDNFFDYVNGTWLKTAKIPPDRSATGAFQDLRILSETRMKAILANLDREPYARLDTEEKKLRDFYDAFMDQKQIEQRGLGPVQGDLATFAALQTPDDVARAMGTVKLMALAPFNMNIDVDPKNSHAYAISITQSGIGMPNRDYYLSNNPEIVQTREAYKKYLATMLGMIGTPDAQSRADAVYAVEEKIAQAQWPNADRRDVDKTYNPMSVSQLEQLAPQFPWKSYLEAAGVPLQSPSGERQLIVAEKSAFPKLAAIFAETPVGVWRDYLTVHYLHEVASYLPKKFDDANFAFYGTVIQGNTQQLDRATRAAHLVDDNLGEALGKLYVAKYFPPAAKAKAEQLVGNLLKAYDADMHTLTWMTPQTRQKALDKLHQFTPHIGYPEKWRDYSAYQVSRDALVQDVENGAVFEWNRELKRIDGQVDRSEWDMSPPTINAYYTPTFNAIFFPAAILQPPFFDPNADDAVNYGGIGAVIGHEISHGFDDQGSKFDGTGELDNWWTPEDRKNFEARTSELVAQVDSYEPLPGLHVNGAFTLGENIADLAGLTIAYKAYHLSLGGKEPPVIDGFTGDQRFFLSMGQIWRSKFREGALRARLLSDPHAPAEFRPISATRNTDAWYTTFDVTPGQKYYLPPDKRVHLW
ncbi:MAG TPA: M13 family metallopeptidase [Rhizomicrobium sp.]|jgi:putative endopeptidase|nr:M13 family metallopeptidase [Rhizomicrobium sp.]